MGDATDSACELYCLKRNRVASAAVINSECEKIAALGCILAEIPCVDHVPLEQLETGLLLVLNEDTGAVEILPLTPANTGTAKEGAEGQGG